MKKDKIHYSFRKVDSYNKKYNFIVSPRCLGKSTALYNKIYKHFKEENKPSIIIRRQIVDITEAYIESIEGVINKFLPDEKKIKFEFKKGDIKEGIVKVFINNQLFIEIAALSNPKGRIKSLYIEDLYCIAFDEFIVDNRSGEKYLSGEAHRFRELYNTFRREGSAKQVKCYFCGNPYSVFNPYWSKEMGIDIDTMQIQPGTFLVGRNFVVDCALPSKELIEWLIEMDMYDPEIDDEYQKYAFGGINVNDVNIKIESKQPEGYKLKYIFSISNTFVGIFVDNRKRETVGFDVGKFWCREMSRKEVSLQRKIYAVDFNNLVNGSRLINTDQKALCWRLKNAISKRDISYQNVTIGYLIEMIYKSI